MHCIRKATYDEVVISFAEQEGKKRGVYKIKDISHAETCVRQWHPEFFDFRPNECEWQLVEFNKEDFLKFKAPDAPTWRRLLGDNRLIVNASRDLLIEKLDDNLIKYGQCFDFLFPEFKPIVVENGNYYTLCDGTSRSFVYMFKIKEGCIFKGFRGFLGKFEC